MRLEDVFRGGQLNHTNAQPGTQSVTEGAGGVLSGRHAQGFRPGETVQGEVVSRNGSQVQIRISDDMVLEARVDRDMNLETGRMMTFEVKNNGQTLTLSPLFANTASQANALKALDMAALPVNQTTVSMTGLMMEAGLPIDRASLQQMYREVSSFPESSVSDIVDLHRLGLPVNEENLAQIASYKNLTHQLIEGLHTVLEALPESMQSMAAEGNLEGAANMLQDLLGMLEEAQNAVLDESAGEEIPAETLQGSVQPAQEELPSGAGTGAAQAAAPEAFGEEAVRQVIADARESVLELADDGGEEHPSQSPVQGDARIFSPLALQEGQSRDPQTAAALTKFVQALEQGGAKEQAEALRQLVARGLERNDRQLLEGLIGSRDVRNILTEGLGRLWSIAPEEVAKPGRVDELYSRLDRQLKTLTQTLEQNGQTDSAAFKAVNNMNQNLDFLQQLNQAYTYVQLPLRLQQGDAHGDLYVYTNKRNLAAKDGQISALLHLDMEHLGAVDVYVAMQAERVNTQFYVRDDEMLGFLEEHMDLLTARLLKRGYHCNCAMQVRDAQSGPKSGVNGLEEPGQHGQPIARYAFDVRA